MLTFYTLTSLFCTEFIPLVNGMCVVDYFISPYAGYAVQITNISSYAGTLRCDLDKFNLIDNCKTLLHVHNITQHFQYR
jgi:hypothetical protein